MPRFTSLYSSQSCTPDFVSPQKRINFPFFYHSRPCEMFPHAPKRDARGSERFSPVKSRKHATIIKMRSSGMRCCCFASNEQLSVFADERWRANKRKSLKRGWLGFQTRGKVGKLKKGEVEVWQKMMKIMISCSLFGPPFFISINPRTGFTTVNQVRPGNLILIKDKVSWKLFDWVESWVSLEPSFDFKFFPVTSLDDEIEEWGEQTQIELCNRDWSRSLESLSSQHLLRSHWNSSNCSNLLIDVKSFD